MKRLTALVLLLSAALGAGPASAMRAHEYLDADQRGPVVLSTEPSGAVSTMPAPPETSATADAQLALPERPPQPAEVAAPMVSTVPEPSGLAMLACGLLLLLFAPYGRDGDAISPDLVRRPDSSL
jgi:hypothetical protein